MQTRDALHQLIDELPDSEVSRASKVLQALLEAVGEGGPLSTIDTAPEDDEPETPEEWQPNRRPASARDELGDPVVL